MSLYAKEEDVKSDLIRALHRWWKAAAGDSDIPDRSAVDPAAFKDLLPYLMISDLELDPFRIRFRLVGTKVVEATGFDFTGHYLDELIPGDEDEPWMKDYQISYDTRRPVFGFSNITTKLGSRYSYEYSIFPLRKNGSAIEQFIALEDYFGHSLMSRELDPWVLAKPSKAAGD